MTSQASFSNSEDTFLNQVLKDVDREELFKNVVHILDNFWKDVFPDTIDMDDSKFFISGGMISIVIAYCLLPLRIRVKYPTVKSWIRAGNPKHTPDVDLYCIADTKREVHNACYPILKHYKKSLVNEIRPGYSKIRHGISKHTYLFKHDKNGLADDIQIIRCVWGTPQSVVKNFDMLHCQPFYMPQEKKLYITKTQLYVIKEKIIKLTGRHSSHGSKKMTEDRIRKWVSRKFEVKDDIFDGMNIIDTTGFLDDFEALKNSA